MSSRFLKSLQIIDLNDDYSRQVKTQLDIVNSYLSIDEWAQEQRLGDLLRQKLEAAKKLKEKLMKFYNIKSHSEVTGFKCQVCNHIFDQPTALGGHMSKAHPYFKKQQAIFNISAKNTRESSIQKIKKEHDAIHLQATGIHRQSQKGILY